MRKEKTVDILNNLKLEASLGLSMAENFCIDLLLYNLLADLI